MLRTIGVASLDDLVRVPDAVALRAPVEVTPQLTEIELAERFGRFAERTSAAGYTAFLGAGAYRHYVPPVVGALAMRGEFLTSYTPYQAEVSQGYLQAIYEWQTYIALLTGLDVANASVYDGATALAEGAIMAVNATGRKAILVSAAVHPNYRAVLRTYAEGLDLEVDELPYGPDGRTDLTGLEAKLADQRYAAVVVQSPNFFGAIDALPAGAAAAIKATKTVVIGVVAEAMSLAALATPACWGAELCVGEGQSFGVAVAYGGPHVGFIAATKEHLRRIPGRLVGKSVDAEGKTAYVLTLQAREQHIRREKATSNICTNQAHCALCATIYLAALGKTGLRDCAALNVARANELRGQSHGARRLRGEVRRADVQRVRRASAGPRRRRAGRARAEEDPGRPRPRALLSGTRRLHPHDGDGAHDERRHRPPRHRALGDPRSCRCPRLIPR